MSAEAFELTSTKAPRARARRGGWSWGPVESAKLRVLSLGAGVQSTTLALMAAHGEIGPMPDLALFADTGDELNGTMETVRWLSSGNVLPFPVRIVSKGERLSDSLRRRSEEGFPGRSRNVTAPFFGSEGGQTRRQCTREFKTEVLTKAQRELLGYKPRQRIPAASIEVWIGYTTDEVIRAGAAFEPWVVHRYPFLEQRMSFGDCLCWLDRNGYPRPPRSKCKFCPYRPNDEWRWMRENEPASFAEAVAIDEMIRDTPGMRQRQYVHASRKPLAEVDLSTAEERGQGNLLMVCEAGCGV